MIVNEKGKSMTTSKILFITPEFFNDISIIGNETSVANAVEFLESQQLLGARAKIFKRMHSNLSTTFYGTPLPTNNPLLDFYKGYGDMNFNDKDDYFRVEFYNDTIFVITNGLSNQSPDIRIFMAKEIIKEVQKHVSLDNETLKILRERRLELILNMKELSIRT